MRSIAVSNFFDSRGNLCVVDALPIAVERLYYISGAAVERGYHAHRTCTQLLFCAAGSCRVWSEGIDGRRNYVDLSQNGDGLLIFPLEYHWMVNFSDECVLVVLADQSYKAEDYIYEAEWKDVFLRLEDE